MKRSDAKTRAAEAMKVLGVDVEKLADMPRVTKLVGHIDSPYQLVVPEGMEVLADPSAGRIVRVVRPREIARLKSLGYHEVQDKRVHFQGMTPGSGVYMWQSAADAAEAKRQRRELDDARRPRQRKRRRGDPVPLPAGAVESDGSPATAKDTSTSQWSAARVAEKE